MVLCILVGYRWRLGGRYYNSNIFDTLNLFEAAKQVDIQRVELIVRTKLSDSIGSIGSLIQNAVLSKIVAMAYLRPLVKR